MTTVQKFIVEDIEKASPLLPAHVALINPDGSPFVGGSTGVAVATTKKAGTVKKAFSVSQLNKDSSIEEIVEAYNNLVASLKNAGIMA